MTSAELHKIFNSFDDLNVIIVGDIMLDSYYWGDVSRISPEAPVPIVAVGKKESRLGGAGNVALNIAAMGANPLLCGVIGKDDNGDKLIKILKDNMLSDKGLVRVSDRPTTTKTRIISNTHHLIRIDEENDGNISNVDSEKVYKCVENFVNSKKVAAIIFEDYDKGVISPALIKKITALASKKGIPTVVDPKKRNFMSYHGVTVFKPNLKELREGIKEHVEANNIGQLNKIVDKLRKDLKIGTALITLSEHGVYVNSDKEKKIIPAHIRKIADVSGAGDSVVSVAALCTALKLSSYNTAALANLAGGQVCEKAGVVPINKRQLLEEAEHYMKRKS
jgi:rfaE bifunctional protein kinase chain/domain